MSLVFDRGNTTLLNPAEISGRIIGLKIGRVDVGDLVKVLDSALFTLMSPRWDVAKDRRVLSVRPIRELVVAKFEVFVMEGPEVVGFICAVMIVDDLVPTSELL